MMELSKTNDTISPAKTNDRNVFIIRYWSRNSDSAAWRVQIEHVQTGDIYVIHSLKDLSAFFEKMMRVSNPSGLH